MPSHARPGITCFGRYFNDAQNVWQVSQEEDVQKRRSESSNERVSVFMSGRAEEKRPKRLVVRETKAALACELRASSHNTCSKHARPPQPSSTHKAPSSPHRPHFFHSSLPHRASATSALLTAPDYHHWPHDNTQLSAAQAGVLRRFTLLRRSPSSPQHLQQPELLSLFAFHLVDLEGLQVESNSPGWISTPESRECAREKL